MKRKKVKTIVVRLTKGQLRHLEKVAKQKRWSLSEAVRELIDEERFG